MYVAPVASECNQKYEPVIGVIYERTSCSDGYAHFYLRPNGTNENELIVLPSNHARFHIIENKLWENVGLNRSHAAMKAYFVDEQFETTTKITTTTTKVRRYRVTHQDGKDLPLT